MDQRALVERAADGDRDAFGALIRPVAARLDAAARLILRDPELARDAVQETLIRAWRDLPRLREPDRFEAWLQRVLVNSAIEEARRRSRRVIEVDLTGVVAQTRDPGIASLADRDALDRVLAGLPPTHRALVVLHYYLGVPLPEAASSLGISLAAAKSRLHRSILGLRQAFIAQGDRVTVSLGEGGTR